MTKAGIFWIAVVVLAASAVILWDRFRTKRILQQLSAMLDAAIGGSFTESDFDESLRSAVETKMWDYLSASAENAGKLQEEKDKIKTLIADISHQTKTPIANVLLYTQLLGEQDLPPESRTCVAMLEEQAEKLQVLIDVLVKTSRLETGILTLHPKPAPLMPMLKSALAQFLLWNVCGRPKRKE